jgi:hypothetical protein
MTYDGFEVNANGATLAVDLTFYNSVDLCLPCAGGAGFMPTFACPETGMYNSVEVTGSTTFTGISGVVETGSKAGSGSVQGQVYLQIQPTYDVVGSDGSVVGDLPTM